MIFYNNLLYKYDLTTSINRDIFFTNDASMFSIVTGGPSPNDLVRISASINPLTNHASTTSGCL